LTPKEKKIYVKTDREWRSAKSLGTTDEVLEVIVEKDWLDRTMMVFGGPSHWVYYRNWLSHVSGT
jgi:hypothetical protein